MANIKVYESLKFHDLFDQLIVMEILLVWVFVCRY